jgi:dTDP-glucose pyrophosphorylase
MKAIITAGGKGSRLFPITRSMPKELINFCGIPVIEYGINFLKANGIKDILIVTGTKKGALQDYIGNGDIFGVHVAYIVQEKQNGLGDAISNVEYYINNDDDFILLLGDTIIIGESDLKEMIGIHQKYNSLSTILVEFTKEPEKYGVVKFDNSNIKILSLYEKPQSEKIKKEFEINNGWYAIAGLYILNRDIFNFLRQITKGANNELQLTDAIKLSLENGKTVFGHVLNGKRIDVGTWEYLKEERDWYINMSNSKLENIVKSRYDKMDRFLNNKKY